MSIPVGRITQLTDYHSRWDDAPPHGGPGEPNSIADALGMVLEKYGGKGE